MTPRLADDLDLIGALDFEPPCGMGDCDRRGELLISTLSKCGCTESEISCVPCRDEYFGRLGQWGVWECFKPFSPHFLGFGTGWDFTTARIEPIR